MYRLKYKWEKFTDKNTNGKQITDKNTQEE